MKTQRGSKAKRIYDSIEDYDGDVLGSLADSSYYNLTKKIFPNSKIIQYTNFYDIFAELLLDSNEGCILEKPIVDYFVNRYPEDITYYEDIFDDNNYGFGFQKNEEGYALLKEFNEFLNNTDIDTLYYKWTHSNNTRNLEIDTNLNTSSEKIINVAINMDFIPLCFYDINDPRGYEYELVYLFAKKYNYQVNFTRLENDSQRISYLTEGKENITGVILQLLTKEKIIFIFLNLFLKLIQFSQ